MKKILITDDQYYNHLLLEKVLKRQVLKDEFYKTIWARDGQEAVDVVHANPDMFLVFMDIDMPVMDGFDAMNEIKRNWPEIPVFAYTASIIFEEDKKKFLEAGFDQCIMKPVSLTDLKESMNGILNYQSEEKFA